MNLAVDLRFSKAEFLRWVQRQEGRYELQNGRVVMMAGGTLNHSRIFNALSRALQNRLSDLHSVMTSDAAVAIGEDIRYPDLVVAETASLDGEALVVALPTLVAEVASPSSLHLDFGIKATEYMSLPSLQTYIVAAHDAPRMWLWERDEEGKFPSEPQIIEGPEASLNLKHLTTTIPLAEVFGAILKK